jgi:hypothetical protein
MELVPLELVVQKANRLKTEGQPRRPVYVTSSIFRLDVTLTGSQTSLLYAKPRRSSCSWVFYFHLGLAPAYTRLLQLERNVALITTPSSDTRPASVGYRAVITFAAQSTSNCVSTHPQSCFCVIAK